jgi:SAM-dependent methyltransferase
MSESITIFNRRAHRRHRDRAAEKLGDHDFLLAEVGERLADRLDDVKRDFPLALDLGCHTGGLKRLLGGRGGIETLIQSDLSFEMARRAAGPRLAADEEALPFAAASLDLVISNLSLHWVNDLPGTLLQIKRALKPDGLFLAAMLGGETLKELRHALGQAEMAEEGGLSPRLSPLAGVRDLGNLLGRAGLAMPVVDADTITVSYADPLKLMRDLRGMGESNAVQARRESFSRRRTVMAAAAKYRDTFSDETGRMPATFQVLYLTAWAPSPNQPKPLKPGSATLSLADALGKKGGK